MTGKPTHVWAAYRDGYLLYESIRGTRAEVWRYIVVLFGINKKVTAKSLKIKLCKVTVTTFGAGALA